MVHVCVCSFLLSVSHLAHPILSMFSLLLLQVQEYYGFLPLTAYLAVNYMDRFLSLHRLPVSSPPSPATSRTVHTHLIMSSAYQITSLFPVSFAMVGRARPMPFFPFRIKRKVLEVGVQAAASPSTQQTGQ